MRIVVLIIILLLLAGAYYLSTTPKEMPINVIEVDVAQPANAN